MKRLISYFKGYRLIAFVGPLLKLVEAILELCVPLVVAQVINQIAAGSNQVLPQIGLLIGLAVLGAACAIVAQYLSAKAAIGYTQQLTQAVFRHIATLPLLAREQLGGASLITRVTNDTYQIQTGLNLFFRLFLRSPFVVFGAVIMAWQLNSEIATYLFGMIVVLYLLLAGLIVLSGRAYQQIRQRTDEMVRQTQEWAQGQRVIRSFNQMTRTTNDYAQVNERLTTAQLIVAKLNVLTHPATYLVVNVMLVLVLWRGQQLVTNQLLSSGVLVALVNYLTLILSELIKTTLVIVSLNKAWMSARRIQQVLDTTTPVAELDSPADSSDIIISALSFCYPKQVKPSLKQVDLSLARGEWLGITGGTGSGKSTLLNVCMGILPFQVGVIDGMAVTDIAWVPQQAQLFSGTIRSNLLLANPTATDEMLWEVLRLAQATDFVMQKPLKLDAPVEPFGRNFSGGQRQRLTIARALLMNRAILLLDDATSALDYTTEAQLIQQLRQARPELTVLFVSQRLNALRFADKVLVLEHGEQTGFGTLAEMQQTNQYYQTLYRLQSAEAGDDNE